MGLRGSISEESNKEVMDTRKAPQGAFSFVVVHLLSSD
jgi:hypothetical protein